MERGIVHTTKVPGDMTPKNVSTHSILSNGLHKNIPSIVPVLDVGVNVCKPLDNIPISTAVDEDVKKSICTVVDYTEFKENLDRSSNMKQKLYVHQYSENNIDNDDKSVFSDIWCETNSGNDNTIGSY